MHIWLCGAPLKCIHNAIGPVVAIGYIYMYKYGLCGATEMGS